VILRRVSPHPFLAPHVEKMWLFESDAGIPAGDIRTIIPNGLFKMIIPYRGSLISARRGSLMRVCPEGSISLVGLMEQPVTIDSAGPSGAIGIEFKPSSAYRFFPFSLKEVRNSVALSDEMLGRHAAEMQRRLLDMPTVEGKLASIQGYLLSMLHDSERSDPLVEWAVGEIRKSQGMVSIIDLCRRSGYSKRYLEVRFADHVGLNPKLLAGIMRFQPVFRSYSQRGVVSGFPRGIPASYYDQSHFIREFKRFTGRSPGSYLNALNDFGEIFYRGT